MEKKKVEIPRDELEKAIREWFLDRVKDGPQYVLELSKFMFGASSAALGVFATLAKVFESKLSVPLLLSGEGILIVSVLISFDLMRPREYDDSVCGDVEKFYNEQVLTGKNHLYFWLGSWIVGVALNIWALISIGN